MTQGGRGGAQQSLARALDEHGAAIAAYAESVAPGAARQVAGASLEDVEVAREASQERLRREDPDAPRQ